MDIDTTGYTEAAKRLVEEMQLLPVIPPKSQTGKYRTHKTIYSMEEDSVNLNELQLNLATTLADDPEIPYWKAYIIAGYDVTSYFNEGKTVKRIKAHLTGMCNQKVTPSLTKLINFLKFGPAEELLIDKTWVLNEAVNLFEISKREKNLTVAARMLDQIASHVDVDAKATNRVEVNDTVDYAALLNGAEQRIKQLDSPDVIEGEFVEDNE